MSAAELRYVSYSPREHLRATSKLRAADELAWRRLADWIADAAGSLPDDDAELARAAGQGRRLWPETKARLVERGLLAVEGGRVSAPPIAEGIRRSLRNSALQAQRRRGSGGSANPLETQETTTTAVPTAVEPTKNYESKSPVPSEQGPEPAPVDEMAGFLAACTGPVSPPNPPPAPLPPADPPTATIHELFPDAPAVPGEPARLDRSLEALVVRELERQGVPKRERWRCMNTWKKALRERGGLDPNAALAMVVELVLHAAEFEPAEANPWIFRAVEHRIAQLQGLEDQRKRQRRGYGGDV